MVDLVCEVEKKTNIQEVNEALKKASQSKKMKGILAVEDAPLVSTDFIGNPYSSIVDSSLTMVNGDVVKVIAWYDNEWGYACRMADFARYLSESL